MSTDTELSPPVGNCDNCGKQNFLQPGKPGWVCEGRQCFKDNTEPCCTPNVVTGRHSALCNKAGQPWIDNNTVPDLVKTELRLGKL